MIKVKIINLVWKEKQCTLDLEDQGMLDALNWLADQLGLRVMVIDEC